MCRLHLVSAAAPQQQSAPAAKGAPARNARLKAMRAAPAAPAPLPAALPPSYLTQSLLQQQQQQDGAPARWPDLALFAEEELAAVREECKSAVGGVLAELPQSAAQELTGGHAD